MTQLTRRELFPFVFGSAALALINRPARASSSASVGAGDSVTIPTAKGSRYTLMKFTNLGPGVADIVVESRSYNNVFRLADGEVLEITEIFGTSRTKVTNNSAAATVKIDSRWL